MSESDSYKPIERFNLEQNYIEFERVHGFDIRTISGDTLVSRPDTRDTRDPQRLGEALLDHAENMTILEYADMIEEVNGHGKSSN